MEQLRLKIIMNCGPCESFIGECLTSVRAQTYQTWEAYLTLDPWGDRTFETAVQAASGDPRIHIAKNSTRLYSMRNLIQGIQQSQAAPDDVIVVLDGDDRLATDRALEVIYPENTTDFRNAPWLGTAIRTWKRWLWDLIDDRDFRGSQGEYLQVTEDQAVMLPILEMSGTERARHIPEALMVYNRTTPHACGKVRYQEMLANAAYLRTLPPYPRLYVRPAPHERPFRREHVMLCE
jgi:glycosyltransferase involved in cell wall biosynthesis